MTAAAVNTPPSVIDSAPASASAVAPVTPGRISELAWSYAAPLIIEAALRNRVFDTLDAGPKTVEEVHTATGSSTRGLTAIMNALCGLELLDKDSQGVYSLTPESATFLVSTKASFFGGLLLHASERMIPRWLHLSEVVETGKPTSSVNQENIGGPFFEQLVSDIFPMSYPSAQALAIALNLGKESVLDLGAGSGVWGIMLALDSPEVRVTAVDWPNVLEVTKKTVARFGLEDRFRFIPGDVLTADFGSGYTIATLGHILHSEGEERSRKLLAKTFAALAAGGTIAIAEFLVNADRKGPVTPLYFAVNMLINTDEGDTFSFEEISSWLRQVGFIEPRQLDCPGPSPLILATRP
jgi:3-hydroxy-5-methyl-1-naphthoate 3-O-methyltransferase